MSFQLSEPTVLAILAEIFFREARPARKKTRERESREVHRGADMSLTGSVVSSDSDQTVIRVYLVNGESRSLRFDERTDVTVSQSTSPSLYLLKNGVCCLNIKHE